MKDLIIMSLRAQREYVSTHIQGKGSVYYKEMMDYLLSRVMAFDDYVQELVVIQGAFEQLTLSNQELKYKKMALQHTIDVVSCAFTRFTPSIPAHYED